MDSLIDQVSSISLMEVRSVVIWHYGIEKYDPNYDDFHSFYCRCGHCDIHQDGAIDMRDSYLSMINDAK